MTTIERSNFHNKRVIVRVDFNVPLNDRFEITDDTRIRAALPTIKKILDDRGSAILMSHLGRPGDKYEEKYSLKHLLPHLSSLLNVNVIFAADCIGHQTKQMAEDLKKGEVLLLENLRFHKEEKNGDEKFAGELAGLADIYVNDAFGTAHRAHASTTIIAKFFPGRKMFGFLIESELSNMDRVLQEPQRPFTAIMGGAKVSDKILIIEQLLEKVDNLMIGGGMTYTFIKAKGGNIGSSLVEEDKLSLALEIMEKARIKNVKFYLPLDNVAANEFSNVAETQVSEIDNVPSGWMGLDIGDQTIELYRQVIEDSKTILWNGPMGVFEMPNFRKGTKAVAETIASSTRKGAFSLIGGGDSVAAINQFNLTDQVSYVSTGGGAMLEYMEGKLLPGIKAIRG